MQRWTREIVSHVILNSPFLYSQMLGFSSLYSEQISFGIQSTFTHPLLSMSAAHLRMPLSLAQPSTITNNMNSILQLPLLYFIPLITVRFIFLKRKCNSSSEAQNSSGCLLNNCYRWNTNFSHGAFNILHTMTSADLSSLTSHCSSSHNLYAVNKPKPVL